MPDSPRLPWLVVDGYNVIGARRSLQSFATEDLDAARESLVSRVAAFAAGSYRAVVVFDAASNPLSGGEPRHVAGVAVVFTAFGHDADEVIERLARRARDRGERITVVTSDAQTQWAVLGEGALRMSSEEFLTALDAEEVSDRVHNPSGSTRSKLQDRIAAETRERLARWARGGQ